MTRRAIGAAVAPPVSDWFCSTTAIASCGFAPYGPAKAMNQVVLLPPMPVSAVPVLPPICRPEIWAAVPVPRLHGAHHHRCLRRGPSPGRRRGGSPSASSARASCCSERRCGRPRSAASGCRRSRSFLPPSPSAAASRAGAPVRTPFVPRRRRCRASGRTACPVAVEATRQALAVRGLERRAVVEPELLGLLDDPLRPELEADVAEDRVDRVLERGRERDAAEGPLGVEVVDALPVHRAVARVDEAGRGVCTASIRARPKQSRP